MLVLILVLTKVEDVKPLTERTREEERTLTCILR